jgi:hypothetical protein
MQQIEERTNQSDMYVFWFISEKLIEFNA